MHKVRFLFLLLLVLVFGVLPLAAEAQSLRVSNIEEVDFGEWDGVNRLQNDDNTCVFRSDNRRYRVIATDDSTITPSAFMAENPTNTVEVPYEIRWRSNTSNGGNVLTDGVPRNQTNATQADELCAVGGLTSNMSVRIEETDLESVPAGFYSAEASIRVEPR